jgi:hypothetical protein
MNEMERNNADIWPFLINEVQYFAPPPLCQIFVQLSNQTQKIKREYEAIVDVLQNIGGFAEILIFFFCYSMVYHHDVLMNLFLLNNSILMNEYN